MLMVAQHTPGGLGFGLREAVDEIRESFASRPTTSRASRGDVRTALLVALLEGPQHGYQLIQAIEERTSGVWKPSPGSVYPTLQLLSDEGLVVPEVTGERKVYALTEEGRAVAVDASTGDLPWESPAARRAERAATLPKAGARLAQAVVQVQSSATPDQAERAAALLDETRRKLYSILAED
ncbi:PadR family transcriptional regulator [Pseudoclavibacter terrae]|uniref:PadR family transcriptional regulator n=2 Tax=Pseudoclavibacter terrae TaxID=1530195 RepID=A0A7J5B3M8_9MICO|nr:PadR family transcriptional regulator [Pseudoclavibacter terrae]